MKNISRIVTVLLILAMILPMAIACAESGEQNETTAPAETQAQDSIAVETTAEETLYAPGNIPEDMRFDGTVINILHWSDTDEKEFFVEDQKGEAVNDAVFKKNANVQEQFGITLDFVGIKGDNSHQAEYVNACVNSTQSGADAYDIFAGYSMTGASLTVEGVVQNMAEYPILDFNQPWWPKSLISKATINGGVYFASGDISPNFLYMMYVTAFNKDLFTAIHQLEPNALYNLVYEGKWTLDKFIEFTQGVYLDLDYDNAASEADRYGLVMQNVHFDAFYTGSDLYTVTVNGDGDLVMSPDLFSQKTVDMLERVCDLIHTSGESYTLQGRNHFAMGNSLFVVDQAAIASARLTDVDFSYGFLPMPKYDEDQEGYRTCLSFPYTVYTLSTAAPDAEASAATIELLAYESYLHVTPAVFEESMKLRYSDQSDDAYMFDKIREGVVIDIGRLFTVQLDNMSFSIFRNAVRNNAAGSYMSSQRINERSFEKKLEAINKKLGELN